MSKLTAKQRLFAEEYIIDHNATRAAKRAGYSEKTAAQTGYENLILPSTSKKSKQKCWKDARLPKRKLLKMWQKLPME